MPDNMILPPLAEDTAAPSLRNFPEVAPLRHYISDTSFLDQIWPSSKIFLSLK